MNDMEQRFTARFKLLKFVVNMISILTGSDFLNLSFSPHVH